MSRIIGFTIDYHEGVEGDSSFESPLFDVKLPDEITVLEVYPIRTPGTYKLMVVCLDERSEHLDAQSGEPDAGDGDWPGVADGPNVTRFPTTRIPGTTRRLPRPHEPGPAGA